MNAVVAGLEHVLVEGQDEVLDLVAFALEDVAVVEAVAVLVGPIADGGAGGVGGLVVAASEDAVGVAHADAHPDDDCVAVGFHGDRGLGLGACGGSVDALFDGDFLVGGIVFQHEHAGVVVVHLEVGIVGIEFIHGAAGPVPDDGEIAIGVHGDRGVDLVSA